MLDYQMNNGVAAYFLIIYTCSMNVVVNKEMFCAGLLALTPFLITWCCICASL